MSPYKSGPWLVVIAALLWAVDAPFRKFLTQDLSSTTIVLMEHITIAVLVFIFLFKYLKELKNLSRRFGAGHSAFHSKFSLPQSLGINLIAENSASDCYSAGSCRAKRKVIKKILALGGDCDFWGVSGNFSRIEGEWFVPRRRNPGGDTRAPRRIFLGRINSVWTICFAKNQLSSNDSRAIFIGANFSRRHEHLFWKFRGTGKGVE